MNTIEKIRGIYIFENLKDEALERIYVVAKRRHFMPGEVVVFEEDEGDSCFLITRGSVEVSKTDEESGETGVIDRLGSGGFFGEMALLGLYTRSATVTTVEETEALEIEGSVLSELFYDDPKLGMVFYRAMARGLVKRLRDTTNELSRMKASLHRRL